jgi:hypothetical protein
MHYERVIHVWIFDFNVAPGCNVMANPQFSKFGGYANWCIAGRVLRMTNHRFAR